MIMISWGRSKPVIGQALNIGSSFSGLSLTAVESTPTFCTKRYQRGPCGRSGTSTWILWLDLEVPWFRTLPPGRGYAFKNRLLPCSLGTLEWIMFSFAHGILCMNGKRRRCKGCHVFGICKEVAIGCLTCNHHLFKTCYLAGHWAKKNKL